MPYFSLAFTACSLGYVPIGPFPRLLTLQSRCFVVYANCYFTVESTVWTKKTLTEVIINHVTNQVKHWKGQCYAWDVVNEGLNEDGTFRNSTFYQVLGPEYRSSPFFLSLPLFLPPILPQIRNRNSNSPKVAIAFRAAHAADPHAKLYYNDYNLERPSPKVTAVLDKIVKPLLKQRVPIHGIGMQAHFKSYDRPSLDNIISVMRSYEALGMDVAITE